MAVKFDAELRISAVPVKAIFILCALTCASIAAKLNVPRILLPYNTGVSTNYTLEVKEGGCYKWSSSRPDLVSVTPLLSEKGICTTKATVAAISRYPERENAIVRAEDEKTGQILRCDVIVDAIHSIEIVTTTRVLFLEDAPEVFEVLAKNDQGDTFSSLEGVAFQWSLDSETSNKKDGYGVLRFLKFADSVYKTPPAMEFWEKQNLHGSMILMEGSKTGSAKVTVRPLDIAYRHIDSYEVRLVIVANLNLKPAHVYLLPGTQVKFLVELIKQGKAYPITLPSDQYYLEVVNSTVAALSPSTSIVKALKLGSTNLVVKDRYISSQEIVYLPSAAIHVTTASYMTFTVFPGDKWSLQEKRTYFISLNLFDRNGHPIHLTEHISVTVDFPTKFFKVIQSSDNGTYHEVYTLVPGSCQVKSILVGVRSKEGLIVQLDAQISASQDVIIYEAIRVIPEFTLLPWDPVVRPSYPLYLKAVGGTGSYNWICSNHSVASVHQIFDPDEPKTRVLAHALGDVKIIATDSHVSMFSGYAEVSVQPAVELKLLPSKVEVDLSGVLNLPLALYGYQQRDKNKKVMFNDCSQVPITVDVADTTKFTYITDVQNASSLHPDACRDLHLQCLSIGYTRILVKYENERSSLLKDTTVVACHKSLKPVHPAEIALLALGSSIETAFEGGPRPWPLHRDGHFITMSAQKTVVNASMLKEISASSGYHVFWVLCKAIGETTVQLEVGNSISMTNPYPAKNKASVRLACAAPDSVIIRPVLLLRDGKKCPISDDEMIAVHCYQDLHLELIVKDSIGRKFSNISSLDIKWQLSDSNLATLKSYEGTEILLDRNFGFKKILKNYQEFHPKSLEGNLKVTVAINGFRFNVLAQNGITMNPGLNMHISHTLSLHLVEDAEVVPKKISVFNNPSNKVYLTITKGSGHFFVETSDPKKAEVVYEKSLHQIEVTPLDTGSFTITIHDLCLSARHEAVAHIQIYDISAIIVDVLDKVELGKSITASVEVLNEDKQKIPASLFSLMELQAVPGHGVLSVKLQSTPEHHHTQAFYTVTGLSLGHTSLKFISAAHAFKGIKHSSELLPIQVFPPLQVNPDNVTLIVGGKFQILCFGGPLPQSNIEYVVEEESIAMVSTGGVVEASKIGKTMLVAMSVGQDKKGHRVIFSQDSISIYVVPLHGMKIHTPLTRMKAGTEMPACAMGLNEQETPFAFGTAYPELNFKWRVNNEKVASVRSVFRHTGIQENMESSFCVRVKANQGGLVSLHLEVTMPSEVPVNFFSSPVVYTDEVQLQVFEKLALTNPEINDGMILLSPNSHLKLKCNRLGPAKVSYDMKSPDAGIVSAVVTVNAQGLLASSTKTGSALLVVTAVEEFGVVQRITVMVKVEEVAYMMIHPNIAVRNSEWSLLSIPVGFTIPFTVSYHDNIGEVFDAVRSHLNFRPSRADLARISLGTRNGTLNIQILKPGYTIVKVWDMESSVSPDYIKLVAGPAIDPSDADLTVSDVICFGSPLLTHEGHRGSWSSESTILAIHPSSGGAIALSPGSTTVTYALWSGLSTATQIRIHAADSISIIQGNLHHISNVPRSKPYHIPVVIHSNGTQRMNNIVGRNCSIATQASMPLPAFRTPLICELTLINPSSEVIASDIFHTTSGFDVEKGIYYCSISAVNKAMLKDIAVLDAQISLSAHLLPQDQPTPLVSPSLILPFLPAFVVHQEEIILTNIQSKTSISITAIAAVQRCVLVGPSDPATLEVLSPESDSKFPTTVIFPVRLRDTANFWRGDFTPLHIDIHCPLNKQQIKIPVKIKLMDAQSDGMQCIPAGYSSVGWKAVASSVWDNYQTFMLTFISVVVTATALIFVCRTAMFSRQGTVTNQPGVFLNRSSLSESPYSSYSPSSPHGIRRFSPPDNMYEQNLSHQTRLWSLDDSQQMLMLRRRSPTLGNLS